MFSVGDFEAAIGLPGVKVVVTQEEGCHIQNIRVKFEASTTMDVDEGMNYYDPNMLWGTVAKQMRRALMAHLFTILEEQESPELSNAKSIARREGYYYVVDRKI